MNLKISFKFRISRKLIIYLLVLIMASIFTYFSYFMYKNFWQVLTYSQEIIALRPEVVSERLRQKDFEEIINSINKKTEAPASISTSTPNLFIIAPSEVRSPQVSF